MLMHKPSLERERDEGSGFGGHKIEQKEKIEM